jgi:CHASE3 domain sensor protein
MLMLAISVGLLLGAGFGAGYSARAMMSSARRSKIRKQRIQRLGDVRTSVMVQAANGNDLPPMRSRTANA